jgi:hypothetical protein
MLTRLAEAGFGISADITRTCPDSLGSPAVLLTEPPTSDVVAK